MSDNEQSIIVCPECESRRFGITRDDPPKAKCADCNTVYPIATIPPQTPPTPPQAPPDGKQKRTAAPGERHRREKGQVEVTPAPDLTAADLGITTHAVQTLQAGGAGSLIAAHKEAARLSTKFGEEFEAKWLLLTVWLHKLKETKRGRARVRFALAWRPRFLAALALSRSPIIGCKAAGVSYNTMSLHRTEDPDFDAQYLAAEAHATQLLHDACFASALEGDCEPVYWQGIRVGHIRKFDSRLRIEMLRAHIPQTFKAPGAGNLKVQIGDGANVLVIGEEQRDALVAMRQESLRLMAAKKANAAVVA